jgi:hypothetical protein
MHRRRPYKFALSGEAEMPETLLSDIQGSLHSWYNWYLWGNTTLLIFGVIIIGCQVAIMSTDHYKKPLAAVSLGLGLLLGWSGISGVTGNFLQARNDLQFARYQYDLDHDPKKLLAAYESAKHLAAWRLTPPQVTTKEDKPGS